jgi:hypothetical protein
MTATVKTWSPPQGLIIQPGAILFESTKTLTHVTTSPGRGPNDESREIVWPACALLDAVSVPRWDLSSLTEAELTSLQIALDAQRLAGVGNPCPATVADRRALAQK